MTKEIYSTGTRSVRGKLEGNKIGGAVCRVTWGQLGDGKDSYFSLIEMEKYRG